LSGSIDPNVMRVARAVTREAVRDGALAVVLTGSYARGDASAHSDIDLIAVLRTAPPDRKWPRPISLRQGHLVTVSWDTAASTRASFRDPRLFTTFVPGWRAAIILHDARGVALRIQAQAREWTWESVADAADAWVAEEITGYAEEVHKLVAALEQQDYQAAAAQRSLLAIHLATIIAVRHRILFGTENVLWLSVVKAMGTRWRRAQARAFGEDGESLAVSGLAALELYALAAADVLALLNRRQRAVVEHACAIAGHALGSEQRRAREIRMV
jgi:hypothetical protein